MARTGYFPANSVMLVDKQTMLNQGLQNNHTPSIIQSPGPDVYNSHHGNMYYHSNHHLDNGHVAGLVHNDVFPSPPSPMSMSKSPSQQSDSRDSGISPQQHHPPYPFPNQVVSPGRQPSPGLTEAEWVRHGDTDMSSFAPSRDSPSGSKRNSAASSGSGGHLGAPNYVSIAVANQQHRLSGQSYESGVSLPSRQSYHSNSSSSLGSLDRLEESGYSSTVNVPELFQAGLPDSEVLKTWLADLHFEEYYNMFVNAGYDMPTITRMTPEDLTAIGITKPAHRKRLKSEISKLHIHDGIPDYKPSDLMEWLGVLNMAGYYNTLLSQSYNINNVTEITWEDLEEIGIKKLGHQKKIILAIDRLKKVENTKKRMSTLERRGSSDMLEQPTPAIPRWAASDAPTYTPAAVSVAHQPPHLKQHEVTISTPRKSPPSSVDASSGAPEMRSFMAPEEENLVLVNSPKGTGLVYQPDVIAIQVQQGQPALAVQPQEPGQVLERGNLTYQSFHGPLGENGISDSSSEGSGGTLKRPSAVVSPRPKPKPVAKIVAKTKRVSREIPPDLGKYDNLDGTAEALKQAAVSAPPPEPIYDNPVEVMEQASIPPMSPGRLPKSPAPVQNQFSSPLRTKKPPPPPRRTNSIKNDIRGLIEQAKAAQAEKAAAAAAPEQHVYQAGVQRLEHSLHKQQDSQADTSTIKRKPGGAREDFPPPPPSIASVRPGSRNPGLANNSLNNVIEQLEQHSLVRSKSGPHEEPQVRRMDPAEDPPSNLLSTSASQNSCSTDTLPFANENVGTIKQKNNQSKPSIVTVNSEDSADRSVDLNYGMFEDNQGTIRRAKPSSKDPATTGTTSQRGAEAKKVPPPTPKRRDSVKGPNAGGAPAGAAALPANASPQKLKENGDVLNEIGNMLQDLTDELDAMLDFAD